MSAIYDFISLYELCSEFFITVLAISEYNLYLFIILICILSRKIIELPLKTFIKNDINLRPVSAIDCNIINKGGVYNKNPGFPSGHSMFATILFSYTLLLYLELGGESLVQLVRITLFFAIAVPYARYKMQCHTFIQVISGALLGLLWGGCIYFLESKYFVEFELYKQHREKLFGINK